MVIIGFLYNKNGMATWCLEAYYALKSAGKNPLLIVSNYELIEKYPDINYFCFDYFQKEYKKRSRLFNLYNRIKSIFLFKENSFLLELHNSLNLQGIIPSLYILNQSNLYNSSVPVPQNVVAWAYPTNLKAYLYRVLQYSDKYNIKILFNNFQEQMYWYYSDWNAYRKAKNVYAVSEAIKTSLIRKNINVITLHPCINVKQKDWQDPPHFMKDLKLVTAALGLESKRKKIGWMIEALKKNNIRDISLSLIGDCSEEFKAWVVEGGFPVTFYGALPREEVLKVMKEQDVFLFGSGLDDWGYVQTEAMSQGIIVIAPNKSPFNEIVGNKNLLFIPDSSLSFVEKVNFVKNSNVNVLKRESYKRALQKFSRAQFLRNIAGTI